MLDADRDGPKVHLKQLWCALVPQAALQLSKPVVEDDGDGAQVCAQAPH